MGVSGVLGGVGVVHSSFGSERALKRNRCQPLVTNSTCSFVLRLRESTETRTNDATRRHDKGSFVLRLRESTETGFGKTALAVLIAFIRPSAQREH